MTDLVEVQRVPLESDDFKELTSVVNALRNLKIQYGEQALPLHKLRSRVEKANLQLEKLQEEVGPKLDALEAQIESVATQLRELSGRLTETYKVDLNTDSKWSLSVDDGCFIQQRTSDAIRKDANVKAARKKASKRTAKKAAKKAPKKAPSKKK